MLKEGGTEEGGLRDVHDYSQFQEGSIHYARPTPEQRKARGCVGRSFVTGTKKFKLDYRWNPVKSVLFGTVRI